MKVNRVNNLCCKKKTHINMITLVVSDPHNALKVEEALIQNFNRFCWPMMIISLSNLMLAFVEYFTIEGMKPARMLLSAI